VAEGEELHSALTITEETYNPEFGTSTKKIAVLERIQAIEEALTKVQEKKAKLLELKHKLEGPAEDDPRDNIARYSKALENAGSDIWADEEAPEVVTDASDSPED
jgi:hypothetical protein